MADGFATTLALSPGQRLLQLHQDGLATRIADERQHWRLLCDRFFSRLENRVIERVLLKRIRRAFDHLDDRERLESILLELRSDYASGRAGTLAVTAKPSFDLEPVDNAPAHAAWLCDSPKNDQLLIYTAGGGFMLPPSSAQLNCARQLGELCLTDTVINQHALAPEAPFPAAINDTVALCQWGIERYGARNVVLAADTAGASVTLGALLKIQEQGQEMPVALQLFSPWNDLSLSGWSYITKSATADSPFRMETAAFCAKAYLGVVPTTDPFASAIFAELKGLPPLAVHTSRYDMHFDDALRMIEKMREAGGHGEIRYWDSPRHHLERFDSKETEKSLAMASGFLRRHLGVRGVKDGS
ncbi:alpha/beta hydrolase [Congregibacter brevis]|uniref:Alpha/beta hydrolase n=1 Tax=Congregibacter brevis TaxID=3081201 RepID=A0ABZ0IFY0_9GAMM|nr:alpha/beta hydrolase [Congregibacter sp. IMCC45268]